MAETVQPLTDNDLFFSPHGREERRPVVAIAAPEAARTLLNSKTWENDPGELAILAVKQQLEVYKENSAKVAQPPLTSLFDQTAQRIGTLLEEDEVGNAEAVTGMFNPALARAVWSWPALPYAVARGIEASYTQEPEKKKVHREQKNDVDTWVLKNEEYLRSRLHKDENVNWTFGLVSLDKCDDVFSSSTLTDNYRKIARSEVDGFKFLDAKKAKEVDIQPNNEKYAQKFEEITNGQLKGLDWSNIFIAGGIALGTLLRIDNSESNASVDQWTSSDIDIYIYGLNPVEANKKIEHLWEIFKQNLPSDAPTLVVRNSKTVSFLSSYPLRRFQIILKLVKNPAEILLNFDLDICAMGFDGEKLWMLPRAARALETGYNVFTMDMVQGHYLGTRRASQEQRVFKYADRGYGIRILPSYIEALKTVELQTLPPEQGRGGNYWQSPRPPSPPWEGIDVDLDDRVAKARDYFERTFRVYMKWSDNGTRLARHYGGSSWRGSKLRPETDKPVFTHALFDTLYQVTSEPLRRSCLTGFELLYRHVALWEAEQEGKLYIQKDVWASTTYEDVVCRVSYEELPCYAWDSTFSTEDFNKRIKAFNEGETDALHRHDGIPDEYSDLEVTRIVSGETLEEVIDKSISIPVWVPPDFVEFAQNTINEVSRDHKDLDFGNILEVEYTPESDEETSLVLAIFELSPVAVYQQTDRRLDEIYEAIWSFMHANSVMEASNFERAKLLRRQFSRRALRRKPDDEMKDFACWVRRSPGSIAGDNYGAMGQGFWWEVQGENEDE